MQNLYSFFLDPKQAGKNFQKIAGIDPIAQDKLLEIMPLLLDELKTSPDPDMALQNFERFTESIFTRLSFFSSLKHNPAVAQMIIALFGHSQFLADTLIRNPEYFDWFIDSAILKISKNRQEMLQEMLDIVALFSTQESKLNAMRRFKRREMLRIGIRDLMKKADLAQSTRELSFLADVCLELAHQICQEELVKQYGLPIEESTAKKAQFCTIGMGKLGGNELNYSSDIDVMFVYSEEGKTNGSLSITNHEFFTKLAQNIIHAISDMTKEGYLFRLDARLRPEGLSGPLVRSVESYENYYAGFGETWERLALIKARPCAGSMELGEAFSKMIHPFIYQKYTGFGALEDLHKIKKRIDSEIAKKGTTYKNVKLGYGGIREIEFSLQMLQLLYGSKHPELQIQGSLPTLEVLTQLKFLKPEEKDFLANAYIFLRQTEHKLQIMHEQQLHTLPDDPKEMDRLAQRLDFKTQESRSAGEQFLAYYQELTGKVHALYKQLFKTPEEKERSQDVKKIEWLFEPQIDFKKVEAFLKPLGFSDTKKAQENLALMAKGPSYMHLSAKTRNLFLELTPFVLDYASLSADPDQALIYLERFIQTQGSRGTFYEALAGNPRVLKLLLVLFGSSQFLSDQLMANPSLFGTLPGDLVKKSKEELKISLHHLLAHETNIETQMMLLRRFKIEEILRIGLRDLLEKSTLKEFFEELSALADLAAETAFSAVMAQLKNKPRLAVIGMGKFGGAELSYSSDLDFIFISDEATSSSANEAVIKIIDFLSRNTSEGFVFRTDARLRPYGEKSVLAPTLQSYQDYFHKNICTWEKQALTKARFICGDDDLGQSFFKLRDELIYGSPLSEKEKEEIMHMRERIEKERNKAKNKQREIKMSAGGILDIEFAVQYLLLKQGSSHPELRVPGTLPALHALAHAKVLSQETVSALEQGYSFLRALENKLRIVKDLALDTLPEDPAELEHCARRMGYQDHNDQTAAQKLNEEYLAQTCLIRENYLHVFSLTT